MTDREANIATIKKAIEAVNLRNFALLREVIHPEFQRHDLAGALPDVSGTEGAVDLIQLLVQAMPDLHIDLKQAIATQDRVAIQIAVSGTHQGELFGVAGTGKRVEMNGINLYRLVDGKIAETWQLGDVWGLMRQVGAAPASRRAELVAGPMPLVLCSGAPAKDSPSSADIGGQAAVGAGANP